MVWIDVFIDVMRVKRDNILVADVIVENYATLVRVIQEIG